MSILEAKIESLIFCSPKPIKVSDIIKAFSESENKNFTEEEINNSINNLKEKYNKEEFSLKGKFKIFNEELVRENLYNSSTKTDLIQSLDELLKIID